MGGRRGGDYGRIFDFRILIFDLWGWCLFVGVDVYFDGFVNEWFDVVEWGFVFVLEFLCGDVSEFFVVVFVFVVGVLVFFVEVFVVVFFVGEGIVVYEFVEFDEVGYVSGLFE